MKSIWAFIYSGFYLFATNAHAAINEDMTISPSGFGPITIGMTFTQAEKAAGMPLYSGKDKIKPQEDCYDANFDDIGIQGITFWIDDYKIKGMVINNPHLETQEGVYIGMSLDEVKKIYDGKWKNFFDDADTILVIPQGQPDIAHFDQKAALSAKKPDSPNVQRGYLFHTQKNRIDAYSAGELPVLLDEAVYYERCLEN